MVLATASIYYAMKWKEFSQKYTRYNGSYDLVISKGDVVTGSGILRLFVKGPKIELVYHPPFYQIDVENGELYAKFEFNKDGLDEIKEKWPFITSNVIEFKEGGAFDNSVYLECTKKVYDYSLYFDILYNPSIAGNLNINNWGRGINCGEVKFIKRNNYN